MSETAAEEPGTLFDVVYKGHLRERFMERLLPGVLLIPAEHLSGFGAPERGKDMFRRACVAERLADAAVYLCEQKYLDDRDGRDRRKDR